MREMIGLFLFFALVGLVHVVFINAVFKAARRGPSQPPRKAGEDEPPRRSLPGRLLRLLPSR